MERRKELMDNPPEHKRVRTEGDDIVKSKLLTIPKNIKNMKDCIAKNSETGDTTRKHNEMSQAFLSMEKRKSVLMSEVSDEEVKRGNEAETFERSASIKAEDEFPELEGVKDPFGKDWNLVEKEKKAESDRGNEILKHI